MLRPYQKVIKMVGHQLSFVDNSQKLEIKILSYRSVVVMVMDVMS